MNFARRLLWQVNRSPLRHAVKAARVARARDDLAERVRLLEALPSSDAISDVAATIERDGFARVDALVERQALEELHNAARNAGETTQAGATSDVFGGRKTLWTHVIEAAMRDGRLDADSPFAQFAMQPAVVAVIAQVLGAVPRLDYVTVTHSLPTSGAPAFSQLWHRDHDDVRVLKLFVYLTDVNDERDGPFTFLPAPLSRRFGYRLRSHMGDGVVASKVDLVQDSVRMLGPRLSAFVVDTSRCLHMGSRVTQGHERLMYTATYFLPPRIFPEPTKPFFRPTGKEGPIERRLLIP